MNVVLHTLDWRQIKEALQRPEKWKGVLLMKFRFWKPFWKPTVVNTSIECGNCLLISHTSLYCIEDKPSLLPSIAPKFQQSRPSSNMTSSLRSLNIQKNWWWGVFFFFHNFINVSTKLSVRTIRSFTSHFAPVTTLVIIYWSPTGIRSFCWVKSGVLVSMRHSSRFASIPREPHNASKHAPISNVTNDLWNLVPLEAVPWTEFLTSEKFLCLQMPHAQELTSSPSTA